MDETKLNEIVEAVVRQLVAAGAISASQPPVIPDPSNQPTSSTTAVGEKPQGSWPSAGNILPSPGNINLTIDLPDPTTDDLRYKPRINNPRDPAAQTVFRVKDQKKNSVVTNE